MTELKTRPVCDICNKPVESFVEQLDDFFREVRFVARCHGEREEVRVGELELARVKDNQIQFARAFARPKLLVVGCKPIDPPPRTVTTVAELNELYGWSMSEKDFKRKYAPPIVIHKLKENNE